MDTQPLERRKEHRLPFSFRMAIQTHSSPEHTIPGVVEDVSLHGLKVLSDRPIPIEETVCLSIPLEESGSHTSEGTIKWSQRKDDHCIFGVELSQNNLMSLSLEHLFHLSPDNLLPSTQVPASQLSQSLTDSDFFSFQLYLGFFLSTFKESLQKKTTSLYYQTDLSLYHTHKTSEACRTEGLETRYSLNNQQVSATLYQTKEFYKDIKKLLSYIRADQCFFEQKTSTTTIDFNHFLLKRAHIIQKKTKFLGFDCSRKIHYCFDDTPSLTTHIDTLAYGLDFLLLHSFQFLLFDNVHRLLLETGCSNGNLYLRISNDGSQMLKTPSLLLRPLEPPPLADYPVQDRHHVTWLSFMTHFFREHSGTIQVHSEAGNNAVLLSLPRLNPDSSQPE